MTDLSADRVTAALRAGGALDSDVSVAAVDASPVGTGQMASCIRLRLTFDSDTDAPAVVVAKIPADDAQSRQAGAAGAYETEVRFYQDLAARVSMRTPRCYYSEVGPEAGEFLLLLEDLAPAEQGDQIAGCSVDQAHTAVVEAAGLHVPTWGATQLRESYPWLVRAFVGTGAPGMGSVMESLYPMFAARYDGRLDAEVAAMGERIVGQLEQYYASDAVGSVVHGDYRLDNMLFATDAGGPPIAIVDWQTHLWGDPVMDVAYFIGAGLLPDDRRNNERALVGAYGDALRAGGVDVSADALWERYRLHAIAGWHMAVFASMVVVQTERGDEMFCVMANRHGQQILDLESEALL